MNRAFKNLLIFALLISSFLSLAAANAEAADNPQLKPQWGQGPIKLSNQFPLALLHQSMTIDSPRVMPEGTFRVRAHGVWSNTFAFRDSRFRFDTETRVGELDLVYAIDSDIEISISPKLTWRGSGITDSPIDSWHKFFGLPRARRDEVPDDEFVLIAANKDGSVGNITTDGTRLSALALGSKFLLSEGDANTPALSLVVSLNLTTGAGTFGQDSFDLEIGALTSKRWDSIAAYAGASYLYYNDEEAAGYKFYQNRFEGFMSGEYLFSEDTSLLVGLYAHSGILRDVKGFPEYAIYLDVGLKHKISEETTLEFLLREDPSSGNDGTTDVSFLLGFSTEFGNGSPEVGTSKDATGA